MADFEETANGDPGKVAQLVIRVAELDNPPLRILAGSDAYTYGREAWTKRLETDTAWESLSCSIDAYDSGNGWERQRGASLRDLTEAQLDAVAAELNDRPRKRLEFQTPNEVLENTLLR
ncbi:hypothetical protein HII28_06830 [Planctomonas sp. JC2975]|uniref:hypothetical protein n=1 Tax=Planctomonas sp. JC2975 TaxID=2729626 RepID=UPI001474E032|nr:hypothetical protein [Planctomonas sp. JC2975]NNC11591.1 hypothetical protein [Planctomonas sp. JC2975]